VNELNLLREITAHQPFCRWIGIEVLEAGPGWVKERVPIRPEFFQPAVVHGGIIYSLADTVTAHAVLTLVYPEEWTTTVEQKISYLKAVTEGAIVGHGRVIHKGNRIVFCEADVFNDAGELVAKSSATLLRIPPKVKS
jgi:acyl-CoA thioesterase